MRFTARLALAMAGSVELNCTAKAPTWPTKERSLKFALESVVSDPVSKAVLVPSSVAPEPEVITAVIRSVRFNTVLPYASVIDTAMRLKLLRLIAAEELAPRINLVGVPGVNLTAKTEELTVVRLPPVETYSTKNEIDIALLTDPVITRSVKVARPVLSVLILPPEISAELTPLTEAETVMLADGPETIGLPATSLTSTLKSKPI